MRVLQLAKFYPPERGGMESIVKTLAEGLNALGLHTDVLCCHRHWLSQRDRLPPGFDVLRAGSLGMLLSTSMAPALIVHLRRLVQRFEVVHVHMPDPMATLALRLAPSRARLVVHWHSDVVRQQRAMRLYEPLQTGLLARADTVIATSLNYAESSVALRPWHHKVKVVPLGIGDNARAVNPARVAALRSQHAGKLLVFALGRQVSYKGFDLLVAAARSLPEDCVVLIGGDGPLVRQHRDLAASLGLSQRVRFLGPIADDDLMNHHAAADVFCMPSQTRAEAFGLAMVEAMSVGKPVVACHIAGSGVPWVNAQGVTGFNVPVGDPEGLAQALRTLLADAPARLTMGQAGQVRWRQQFSSDRMVRDVAALYG